MAEEHDSWLESTFGITGLNPADAVNSVASSAGKVLENTWDGAKSLARGAGDVALGCGEFAAGLETHTVAIVENTAAGFVRGAFGSDAAQPIQELADKTDDVAYNERDASYETFHKAWDEFAGDDQATPQAPQPPAPPEPAPVVLTPDPP